LLSTGHAVAQGDLKPVPPNILLLVDTSGSMDYKTSSNDFPTCRYMGTSSTANTSERSRWIDLVEVMTGSISAYQCQRLDRNSTDFRTEFALGGSDPYDFIYPNPYHRPASDTCVPGPGTLDPSSAAAFPASAIKYHPYDNASATCNFDQTQDGILDSFFDQVRFGLMTFDTDPRPGPDVSGLWSYYLNSSRQGEPTGCIVPQDQEVGVRNASAPPWEGRAVGFGDPAPGSTDYQTRNAMIQKILLATRPYGATPIAGMLDDARAFLKSDTQSDPLNTSIKFGPLGDTAVTAEDACRKQAIILLSDGQPNMDLRPFCEPNGCPYDKAEDIALDLKNNDVETFVIGFALPKVIVGGLERTCASFADSDFDTSNPTGICASNPTDASIQACCALNRIAAAGGHAPTEGGDEDWRRAHFADNVDELRFALQKAIGTKMTSTTRIQAIPVAGPGFINNTSNTAFATGFRFGASVSPASLGRPWTGDVTRQRYTCEDPDADGVKTPELQTVQSNKGDNFTANVNHGGPEARTLITVLGTAPAKSDTTIRPNLAGAVNDGAGNYSGTQASYTSVGLVAAVTPEAMKVDAGTCVGLTAAECRDRQLNWWVGLSNGTPFHRCPRVNGPDDCALIGDFLHAAPRPVPGRPNELLNDASYEQFQIAQIAAKRPSVLYAASNDGFLHAFKIAQVDKDDTAEVMKVMSLETNELWAFIPPAVLPNIPSLYPGSHQKLLDGNIAVKDVVATFDNSMIGYKYRLQRSKGDAELGAGTWRTILVQSFGAQRPGYYALDITDPVPSLTGGPKLLWQLVTDSAGKQLFGSGGATPLITTVFLGDHEVAVAVLPGGHAPASDSGPCTRKTTDFTAHAVNLTGYMPRDEVPCYGDDPTDDPAQYLARSLTVVRLDTGEILRSFRQDSSEVPTLEAQGVVTESPLDSPLTGQPVAFPADAGAVADRVFIGDQDGTLWRLNFASDSGSPADWKMDLFFDAFPGDGTFTHTYQDGQPIETPPIISVNELGNLTVALSTGLQDVVGGAPKLVNYVWSLTEKPTADRQKLLPAVNWYKGYTDAAKGERVVGAMALFNRYLYFSTMGVPAASSCDTGEGKLWAMHYIQPNTDGPGTGGVVETKIMKALTGLDNQDYAELTAFTDGNSALSGVTVAQEPTCANPGSPGDDQYFQYGTHNALGNVTGGGFQLLIPIGAGSKGADVDAEIVTLGEAKALAVGIETPEVLTRVDSWAAIVE
jgi:type IV pilus assembly protein PilY1